MGFKFFHVEDGYEHTKEEGKGSNPDYFKITIRVVGISDIGEIEEMNPFKINVEELPQPGYYLPDLNTFSINGYNFSTGFITGLVKLDFKPLGMTRSKIIEGMVKLYKSMLTASATPVQAAS